MEKLFKQYLWLIILVAGVGSALVLGMDLRSVGHWSLVSLAERDTLELVLVIYLVLLLSEILDLKKSLGKMVQGLAGLLRKTWLIIAVAPAFFGLLPMPGGALVSAPILTKALGDARISPELKTFVNYWFRHIWEYSWPLYPGIILTSAIFGVPVTDIIRAQWFFTPIAAAIGALSLWLYFARFRKMESLVGSPARCLGLFLAGAWEILLVVVLIAALKVYMLAALGLAVMLSLLLLKADWRTKLGLLVKAFKIHMLAVLVAVMIFKNLILHSDMDVIIKGLVAHAGAWRLAILFAVPFLAGFLTGVNQSFAAISFPILVPIVGIENPDLRMIAFLYVSGYAGVLLSPVHLCLVLSAEYYGANLARVFRYLVPPAVVLILLAFLIFGTRL